MTKDTFFDSELQGRAAQLVLLYKSLGLKLATAESCTGGLVAALLTEVPGSSVCVERGFVTYSNAAKEDMLGVPAVLIANYGAVSLDVARAMAEGALDHSVADIAVSITGIAGPGGETPGKPVGLVHFACATRGAETISVVHKFGDLGRSNVRRAAVLVALDLLAAAAR